MGRNAKTAAEQNEFRVESCNGAIDCSPQGIDPEGQYAGRKGIALG